MANELNGDWSVLVLLLFVSVENAINRVFGK